MSPKITSLTAGLTALGLFGFATATLADPAPTAPPDRVAPTAPTAKTAVLLLSDGRVLQGKVLKTDSGYVLQQRGGLLPLRGSQVERLFGSLEEVYRYKAGHVPPRDPDEQLKLAQWCLTNNLPREAKAHLRVAHALSPSSAQIRSMLDHLEASESQAAMRDTGVVRTEAEVSDNAPGELPNDLRKRIRGMGVSRLPQILDLPNAQAVKRAKEFDNFVHPVLQYYCARCHNENYPGKFQLIEVKSRRDRSLEVFRANLDATLRLVDADDPAKSELLSTTLRPHGKEPRKRPIFLGSNDRAYLILSTWVNSLRSSRTPGGTPKPAFTDDSSAPGEEFAAQHEPVRTSVPTRPQRTIPNPFAGVEPQQIPPSRYVPGRGMVFEEIPENDAEFPKPLMNGGTSPKPAQPNGQSVSTEPAARPANSASLTPDAAAAAAAAGGRAPVRLGDPVPKDDPAAEPPPSTAPKKPRKPVKIDPALLQKALSNRFNQPK